MLAMKPKTKEDLTEELVEDELFIHEKDASSVHCLNAGAAVIWYLCDGTRDSGAIAQEIADANGLSVDDVRADVERTVEELRSLGLLEA